jgi:hypothetical protein
MVTSQNISWKGKWAIADLNQYEPNATVKEQRVDGSWHEFIFLCLRYTLMGFERNYPIRIPSEQYINNITL